MKKIIFIFVVILISLLATALSIFYQTTYSTTQGNSCCIPNCSSIPYCYEENPRASCDYHPECYDDYPSAGFPFAYLYDNTGISVVGSLDIGEDNFSLPWFFIDFVFYFIIFSLVSVIIRKKVLIKKIPR